MALIQDKIYYTYNDVTIMPCVVSDVEHRSECNPFDEDNHLPLFTAPMDTVVNSKNFDLFEAHQIYAILPRTELLEVRIRAASQGKWSAFSLDEFESIFCNKSEGLYEGRPMKVLIDVANGHMAKIFMLASKAKDIWGDKLVLMGGNIANPETYEHYAKSGFSFVRCGIGGGCFVGDTEVTLSNNDKKKIKDIQVGDKVKTIKGDFDVIGKKEEKTNSLVAINGSIMCTPNHKFLVIDKDKKENINEDNINEYAYYIESKELDKNKHLLVKML